MTLGMSLIQNGLNSVSKATEAMYAGNFPCVPGSGNVSSHASHLLLGSDQQFRLGVLELRRFKTSGPHAENQCRIAAENEHQV